MPGRLAAFVVTIMLALTLSASAGGATRLEYENRLKVMVDLSVRLNEYVRRHLGDRSLAAYAQTVVRQSVINAERMTPPKGMKQLHPHLLLVLENIERSFHHASERRMDRYRHHQKIVRRELNMLEDLAARSGIHLYAWDR